LSTAERTGSPVFHTLWSYVLGYMRTSLIHGSPSPRGVRMFVILSCHALYIYRSLDNLSVMLRYNGLLA
ncbi:hypothetical protein VN97_g12954, partial [Penicillium thymicola]